ncbi:MAG: hypothetical protein ACRBBP_10760 [Bdellovibrionales bacterium]
MKNTRNFPPGTFETTKKTENSAELDMSSNSSVSSLISHNQDLASRLNVAIGRNIELEKTLVKFKKVHAQYEAKFQSAKDHVSLHKEKEKFLQNESNILKQKIQTSQAYLTQERKTFEKEQTALNNELNTLRPILEEYRKLKNLVETEYLPERNLLQETVSEKKSLIEGLEEDKTSLLKKLAEASDHIQKIAKEFKDEVERKELEAARAEADLKAKLDDVQSENLVLNDRNRTLRKEQIENTDLLNRIEELKKEKELNIYQARDEKEDLLLQLSKMKKDNDRLKMENHSLKKQWANTQTEFRTYKSNTTSQADETTSLRALWQEKSNEYSQLTMLNDSLKTQITELEKKMELVSEMHTDTKQRLNFFFSQLDKIKDKQDEDAHKGTEAMERAFKKAIEPFNDFDYNL